VKKDLNYQKALLQLVLTLINMALLRKELQLVYSLMRNIETVIYLQLHFGQEDFTQHRDWQVVDQELQFQLVGSV